MTCRNGPVLSSSLVFAPLGQPPGHLQSAAAELVQPRQPPPSLLVGPLQGAGEEVGKFGLGPVGSPHLLQLGFQMIGDVQQMAHIIECIP